LAGSKHVEFLVNKQLITRKPSTILDELYSKGNQPFQSNITGKEPGTEPAEKMVLHKSNCKPIATALGVPELETELDRAIWQVEKVLHAEQELLEQKKDLEKITKSAPGEKGE
jgi:hypothetical protein